MPFHTSTFAILLSLTWLAWLVVPPGARWVVLLGASAYFCGSSHPMFLLQVVAASMFAYVVARKLAAIPEVARRKPLLTMAICALAANLALFKYAPAFDIGLLLPIGISFYTFQLIGYLVDVHRGLEPEKDLRVFSLFVLLFPKMVSGPIERARNLLPQLRVAQRFDYSLTVSGLSLILWGLFKKLVIADHLAPFVNHVFDDPAAATGPLTLAATILYAFQLYCDFSGYTDIAIGTAALFGYRLLANFNRPYIATSIQDFWKRWHISLTSWLTDYVYTPMTRQKKLKIKFYHAMLGGLFITFVISGVWHGSHWNFVAWGALHGAYIVISLQTQKLRNRLSDLAGLSSRPRLRRAFRIGVTFMLVCLAYVLFRASSLSDAMTLYASLAQGWDGTADAVKDLLRVDRSSMLLGGTGVLVVLAVEALGSRPATQDAFRSQPAMRVLAYCACAFAVIAAGAFGTGSQDFIYFRF